MVNTSTIVLIVAVLLLLLVFLALFYRRMTGVPATVAAAPSPGATTYASTAPSTYSQAAAGGAYGSQLQAAPVTAPTHFVQPPSTTVVVPPATSGSTAPLLVTNTSTVSSSGTATSSGTAQPMGVQLFAHTGLSPTDNTMFLPPGDYRFSTSPWSRFNNEASGLRVSSGCTAQFWANNDFTGKTLTYTGPFAVSDLGPTGLKNDISAVKVRCS